MSRIVHARLDVQTERLLRELERRLGWNDSQVVGEGIKALNAVVAPRRARPIVGLGRFRSGFADLGSNKARLKTVGR